MLKTFALAVVDCVVGDRLHVADEHQHLGQLGKVGLAHDLATRSGERLKQLHGFALAYAHDLARLGPKRNHQAAPPPSSQSHSGIELSAETSTAGEGSMLATMAAASSGV